ncbi:response regulator transcription factor [Paeniglutamicibacter sp. R2-26]|uniref:response regulator transcription factor n=1 Tax=Paeniglutamicibacter sp. R2-26 TaxID=3144417 RepID=UPI003EE6CBA1
MRSPIAIARGPRGSGKSTAVRDWLERRDPQATTWSWINLPKLDKELSLESSGQGAGGVASMPPDAEDLDHLRLARVRRMFDQAATPESHLLVLDAFSTRHEAGLMAWLEVNAERHPGRRVLIITHEFLVVERRRTLADFDVSVLPPHEFAFTIEETALYLEGTRLAEFAAELAEETCGSVALLRLAKLRADSLDAPRSFGGTFPPDRHSNHGSPLRPDHGKFDPETRAVVDTVLAAIRRDVLLLIQSEDLEPERLEFFAAMSVPSLVDESIASELYPEAQTAWISDLESRGLAYRTSRNPERELRINPVFRRVLQDTYLAPDPERLRDLNERCARFEIANGSSYRALRHSLEAANYALASEILRTRADEYVDGELGRRGCLLLDKLPMTVLAKYPMLSACLAIAYSATGKFKFKTLELLALAATGARTVARKGPAADKLVMLMIESVAMRLSGFGDRAARAARAGIALYREMGPADRDEIGPFEGAILVQFALAFHSVLLHHEALEVVELAVAVDRRHDRSESDKYAGTVRAYLYALRGDIRLAQAELLDSRPEHWSNPAANAYFASPFRLASFICALEEQRFDQAAEWMELLGIDLGGNEFWPAIRLAESVLAIVNGESTASFVRMQNYLMREREQPIAQKFGRQMLAEASSLLNLAAGDAGAAHRMTAKSTNPVAKRLLQARIRLAEGDAAEVLRLCAIIGTPVSPRPRFEQAVLVLAATLQQKNQQAIGGAMRLVAALSEECGLGLALNLLPAPDLERVLGQARSMGVQLVVDENVVSNIPGGLGRVVLSERELAVLAELATTGSVAEIAERQFVSVNTVKSQLRSVYRKLGVSERAAAIEVARVQGLLVLQEHYDEG